MGCKCAVDMILGGEEELLHSTNDKNLGGRKTGDFKNEDTSNFDKNIIINQQADGSIANKLRTKAAKKRKSGDDESQNNANNDEFLDDKNMNNTNNASSAQKPGHNSSRRASKDFPKDSFSRYIFEHINMVRKDPTSIINSIKRAKEKISKETIRRNNEEEERFIYKGTVKVALFEGASAFDDAITDLQYNIKPMEPLIYSENITVFAPKTEKEIKDKEYIKTYVKNLEDSGYSIDSFWRDIVKDAETSFILMIVDDTGKKSGMKRNDIFNPEYKYIGISSNKINKTFAAYLTFSK